MAGLEMLAALVLLVLSQVLAREEAKRWRRK